MRSDRWSVRTLIIFLSAVFIQSFQFCWNLGSSPSTTMGFVCMRSLAGSLSRATALFRASLWLCILSSLSVFSKKSSFSFFVSLSTMLVSWLLVWLLGLFSVAILDCPIYWVSIPMSWNSCLSWSAAGVDVLAVVLSVNSPLSSPKRSADPVPPPFLKLKIILLMVSPGWASCCCSLLDIVLCRFLETSTVECSVFAVGACAGSRSSREP